MMLINNILSPSTFIDKYLYFLIGKRKNLIFRTCDLKLYTFEKYLY